MKVNSDCGRTVPNYPRDKTERVRFRDVFVILEPSRVHVRTELPLGTLAINSIAKSARKRSRRSRRCAQDERRAGISAVAPKSVCPPERTINKRRRGTDTVNFLDGVGGSYRFHARVAAATPEFPQIFKFYHFYLTYF